MYGDIVPIPESRVIVADDGRLRAGGRPATFSTEGHARHHYCLHDPASPGVSPATVSAFPIASSIRCRRVHLSDDHAGAFRSARGAQGHRSHLELAPERLYLTHYSRVTTSSAWPPTCTRASTTSLPSRAAMRMMNAHERMQDVFMRTCSSTFGARRAAPRRAIRGIVRHGR